MAENFKSLTLTKSKTVDIEGEHRVTFIASTANEDRDYEHVEIGSFRLPLKGGGHIIVNQLPASGFEGVDIPFLLDHDLWSVEKVIGSVRRAFWDGTNLIFEAGFSNRERAQDVFKLLEEGHLDNAFSIQYRDYDRENDTDYNGEIIEVSLVTRGANADARVLAVKTLKEEEVEENTTKDEEIITPAVEETPAEPTTPEVVEEPEATEPEEKKAEEPTEPTESETEEIIETIKEEKETPTMEPNDAIKSVVKEATQAKTASTNTDYLKSKGALRDFAKIMYKSSKLGNGMEAWKENLAAKGVNGDALLPSRIENIIFQTWEDKGGVLGTFAKLSNRHASANAFYGANPEDIRAKGNKKGQEKAEQAILNRRRDLSVKVIYKMLNLDWQDIVDDEDGELLAFRTRELAERVAHEIALGAIIGDGRAEPDGTDPDYRVFDGTRGLFSMVGDINGSSVANSYASFVATKLDYSETDTVYAKIIKTLAKVKALPGRKKNVIVPAGTLAELQLVQNETGGYLFQPGTDFVAVFGAANIFEFDEMAGSGFDVIAYADEGYVLTGTDDVVRTGFDIKTNKDMMLVERAVAGSLAGSKVCAGYPSATASA